MPPQPPHGPPARRASAAEAVDLFEEAWIGGAPVQVADLPARARARGLLLDDPLPPELLFRLIGIDLEYRWRLGRELPPGLPPLEGPSLPWRPLLEEYARRFPHLGPCAAWPAGLVAEEYRARRNWGDRPARAEYTRRFPDRDGELAGLFDAVDADLAAAADSVAPAVGGFPAVSGYEILGEVGQGGMGVVYRARHLGLNRLVALKMLRVGQAAPQQRARFQAEAKAAARFLDPHIAQIFEVGDCRGQPYLALEYVEGGSLDRLIRGAPQAPRESARLVATVARAVQAAHAQGLVHRDLKPANILMSGPPGAPWWERQPKVSDFGLAKQLGEDAGKTREGAAVGTPSYMAPEQAAGKLAEIGPWTDVWALGAVLYELLTGKAPFAAPSAEAVLDLVRQADPVPPRQLQAACPRDLETICLKCLRKDPARRYAGAQDLADDLGRFLDGRPVHARPTPLGERLVKWSRRNPWTAATGGGVALSVALVITVLAVVNVGVKQERDRAEGAERELGAALVRERRVGYYRQIALAQHEWRTGNLVRAEGLLDACPPELRCWEWHYLRRLCRPGDVVLDSEQFEMHCIHFSPDGRRVLAGGEGAVWAWDLPSGIGRAVLRLAEGDPFRLALSPDGSLVGATTMAGPVEVWDLEGSRRRLHMIGHRGPARALAFSPDGKLLATGGDDRTVRLWDARSGRELWSRTGPTGRVHDVTFSPDGGQVACASGNRDGGEVLVWDVAGQQQDHIPDARGFNQVAFSPDGKQIAASRLIRDIRKADEGEITVWDRARGTQLRVFRGATWEFQSLAFSPGGGRLAACNGRAVHVWNLATGAEEQTLWTRAEAAKLSFSRDGSWLAVADGPALRLWGTATGEEGATVLRGAPDCPLAPVAFSPDGRLLAASCADGTLRRWDLQTHAAAPPLEAPGAATRGATFGGTGALATCGPDGSILLWDPTTWASRTIGRQEGVVRRVAVRPDTGQVASSGAERAVRVWDARTGKEVLTLVGHTDEIRALAYSPDGARVVSAGNDYTVRTWDANSGAALHTCRGHTRHVVAVAFSPDGKRLASAGDDGTVRAWEADSGEQIFVLRGHLLKVTSLAFSPDGMRLASGSDDKTIRLWDAATGAEVLTLRGLRTGVLSLAFSPDGRTLAASGWDGLVRVWETAPRR